MEMTQTLMLLTTPHRLKNNAAKSLSPLYKYSRYIHELYSTYIKKKSIYIICIRLKRHLRDDFASSFKMWRVLKLSERICPSSAISGVSLETFSHIIVDMRQQHVQPKSATDILIHCCELE